MASKVNPAWPHGRPRKTVDTALEMPPAIVEPSIVAEPHAESLLGPSNAKDTLGNVAPPTEPSIEPPTEPPTPIEPPVEPPAPIEPSAPQKRGRPWKNPLPATAAPVEPLLAVANGSIRRSSRHAKESTN